MPDIEISVDEYLMKRKDFTTSDGVVRKAVKAPASYDDAARSARFIMSTEEPDRDNDIVMQAGINLDAFLKNPVAPFGHRSHDFSVGSWENVEKILNGRPKRMEGTLKFLPAGGDAVVDRAAFHVKHGALRACSIGFMPKRLRQRERDTDDGWPGYEILESELVECSLVSVPANPSAMAKSINSDEEARWARDTIEEVLDNWAKHPETGLLIPRSEFEAAAKSLGGEKTSVVIAKGLTEDAEQSLLDRFTSSFKALFATKTPEPEAPKPASAEAKAAALARLKAYREKALPTA